jgi:hypothetical protein
MSFVPRPSTRASRDSATSRSANASAPMIRRAPGSRGTRSLVASERQATQAMRRITGNSISTAPVVPSRGANTSTRRTPSMNPARKPMMKYRQPADAARLTVLYPAKPEGAGHVRYRPGTLLGVELIRQEELKCNRVRAAGAPTQPRPASPSASAALPSRERYLHGDRLLVGRSRDAGQQVHYSAAIGADSGRTAAKRAFRRCHSNGRCERLQSESGGNAMPSD